MDVSIDSPPFMAAMLHPFPRWHVIILSSSMDLPSISAARIETYLWEVPWNQYFRILCSPHNSKGRA